MKAGLLFPSWPQQEVLASRHARCRGRILQFAIQTGGTYRICSSIRLNVRTSCHVARTYCLQMRLLHAAIVDTSKATPLQCVSRIAVGLCSVGIAERLESVSLYTFPGGTRMHYAEIANPFNAIAVLWLRHVYEIRIFDEVAHGSFSTVRQGVALSMTSALVAHGLLGNVVIFSESISCSPAFDLAMLLETCVGDPRVVALFDDRVARPPVRRVSIVHPTLSVHRSRLGSAVVDLFCLDEHRFQPDDVYLDRRASCIDVGEAWLLLDAIYADFSAAFAWDSARRLRSDERHCCLLNLNCSL